MTTPITKEQLQRIIESADDVLSAQAGTNEDVHPESDDMIRLWDYLNDVAAPPAVVKRLAEIARAAMDAEPVAVINGAREPVLYGEHIGIAIGTHLYTAPPAPVCSRPVHPAISSEELDDETLDELIDFRRSTLEYHSQQGNKVQTIIHGVTLTALLELRERRAAMLQADNSPAIQNGWIPVSERVPEVGQAVLAYRPDAPESDDPLIKMAVYTGKSHHGFNCYCTPTHWMPLPAAPQQEGEGQNQFDEIIEI
ncbi:DUF551 domain-containing protein [Escherichia coli]